MRGLHSGAGALNGLRSVVGVAVSIASVNEWNFTLAGAEVVEHTAAAHHILSCG